MGESTNSRAKLRFDRRIRLEFHGATITSNAGLLACRELDDALCQSPGVYRPFVARVIEPPCGPLDGLLSPLGLRVNHLLSIKQRPVW